MADEKKPGFFKRIASGIKRFFKDTKSEKDRMAKPQNGAEQHRRRHHRAGHLQRWHWNHRLYLQCPRGFIPLSKKLTQRSTPSGG